MSNHDRSASKIGASIDQLRRQLGLGSTDALSAVTDAWADLVGEELAGRTRIVELRQGTLTIDAHDPGAAEALGWSEMRILGELVTLCPREKITAMTIRVRRAPRP